MWLGLLYTETQAAKENCTGGEGEKGSLRWGLHRGSRSPTLAPSSPGEMARKELTSAYPMGHAGCQHGPPWPVRC